MPVSSSSYAAIVTCHTMWQIVKITLMLSDYFKRKGVSTLTVKELFDFVTDVTITADNLDEYLDHCMEITSNRTVDDVTEQDKIDEAVNKCFVFKLF